MRAPTSSKAHSWRPLCRFPLVLTLKGRLAYGAEKPSLTIYLLFLSYLKEGSYSLVGLLRAHKRINILLLIHRNVDEQLVAYVVLKTPLLDDGAFQALLSRLVISIEAYAISTVQPQPHPAPEGHVGNTEPAKEQLFSIELQRSLKPITVAHESKPTGEKSVYAFWRFECLLGTPKSDRTDL